MTPPPKRPTTSADRDVFVPKHGVPVEVHDEATGVLVGPELKAARARRGTHERIEKLEDTKDEHIAAIAGIGAQLSILVKHAEDTESYRRDRERREAEAAERERIRKWWIAIITAVGVAIAAIVAAVH